VYQQATPQYLVHMSIPTTRTIEPSRTAPGRPVRLATVTLSDAVKASRAERRELVLLALEVSRANARRRQRIRSS
jgi:hypothetical protein